MYLRRTKGHAEQPPARRRPATEKTAQAALSGLTGEACAVPAPSATPEGRATLVPSGSARESLPPDVGGEGYVPALPCHAGLKITPSLRFPFMCTTAGKAKRRCRTNAVSRWAGWAAR